MGRIAPLLCLLSVAAASRHHVVGVRPQGELTLDAEDDAHGRHLQQTSQNRALCPDDSAAGGAMSGVRTLTSEQGLNAIQLGGPDGYAAFLFCKWRISPGQPRVTLLFNSFDVPCCGKDVLEVYQEVCPADARAADGAAGCTKRRTRVKRFSYPQTYADVGNLPAPLTVNDPAGVVLYLRFRAVFAVDAEGFDASYTSKDFSLLAATPRLFPTTLGTSLTLQVHPWTLALLASIPHAPPPRILHPARGTRRATASRRPGR